MSDIPERAPDRLTRAEAKFAEFLRMKAENLNVSLEALCAENPDDATALRVLYSIYDEGRSAAENPTLGSRLEKFFGATVVERTALESVASPPDDAAAPGGNPPREALPLGGHRREDGARYDMKEELARGGMGIILRVWDRDLNRQIAMKVLPPGARGSPAGALPEHLPRFLEEAQVTAQLDHPGIVPVHELGVDANGRLYFTMQLVKGGELKGIFELARAGKDGWNVPRAVGVVVKACQAVAYAHAKGVIHRDLKPANVMVGRFGEVYVMDWGLARVLGRADRRDLRIRNPDEEAVVSTLRRDAADSDPSSILRTL
ncbi:MAG TPA: serine/threonine-protein kinase, partial [Planctomycetota bacterium]|nr:serine/threonine-protein kinase [Planctomycetota bacterium]